MQGLRAALGDERANAFISSIGTAALRAAPLGLNVSLETVLAGTLGRLTQEDLAGIARGETGAINRAQAIAEDQVKSIQNSQSPTNMHAAPGVDKHGAATGFEGKGQWIGGVWVPSRGGEKGEAALSMRGETQSKSGAYARELNGKASPADVAPGTGYSWLSPANQNIPGFNQAQVAGAANFLKNAGLSREDVNHDTRHMVHLQKHQGEIGDLIKQQRDIDQRRARGENVDADQGKLDEKKK